MFRETVSRAILMLAMLLMLDFSLKAQNDDFETIVQTEKSAWLRNQKAQERGGLVSAVNRSDIQYCRLHWTVDPAVKYIRGTVMTVFEPYEILSSLEFDFSEALTMDSVLYHGQKLIFTRLGDVLTVEFPQNLAAQVKDSLTFYYQGIPTSTGFGSFETGIHGPDSIPVLWTLSEPYGAKEWWPCKQSLDDKIDSIDVFINHPAGYRAASNGLLVSEVTIGNTTTTHWKHQYPIAAYLICMAVTNYVEYENLAPFNGNTTTILNYVYPESVSAAMEGTAEVVAQMQLFDDLFGLYPFQEEKYGHAQFNWGGGMEHQTMTFVGSWGFELLGHELAHHWFGDKVTCGTWQDIWLNEGFATYLSGLCYEFLLPQYWQNFKQNRIDISTNEQDGSVFVPDTTSVARVFSGRLSYAKGAMVLHMLRWVCGDDAFFEGVRNYLNDPNLAYSYAKTDDLKNHLELSSGKNLNGFFADWYYGEGYPGYQISWSKKPTNEVTIKIDQTQSSPTVSFFEMPLQLKLSDGMSDTMVVLNNTSNGQSFTLQLDFSPTMLEFDPNLWIVSRNNFVQELTSTGEPVPKYDLTIMPNPTHGKAHYQLRIDAGSEIEVHLINAEGRLIKQDQSFALPGVNKMLLDVHDVPAGWYQLQITGKDFQIAKKIMVQ
ncbi:MAG: T9SS type A sorting domain-containing protein [Lewinellaceae bacterium]|nr:T9SS type A sorting domain-containing protein [Saprospiraceae bacterium]MCB9343836.1 T9SS type A sorting domain-containing protein [Lewinellaceae bacterium]